MANQPSITNLFTEWHHYFDGYNQGQLDVSTLDILGSIELHMSECPIHSMTDMKIAFEVAANAWRQEVAYTFITDRERARDIMFVKIADYLSNHLTESGKSPRMS